jgi:hypothetical protein
MSKKGTNGMERIMTQTEQWQMGITFSKINLQDIKNIKMSIGIYYTDIFYFVVIKSLP